ncbi:MAG: carbohydrate ABC transporter permease [Clostridia bacterium]|nr:carbohydrate ABC transporter permease [Clostridia bacterium]
MLYVLLTVLVIIAGLPLFAMVCRSLMPLDELYIYPPRLIVHNPTLRNFSDLLTSLSSSTVPFTRYIFNSLFTTVVTVVISVVVCSMGAYGLVKHKPAGSGPIFAVVLAALMFSTHVTQIPNYLVVNRLGLVNTYLALIIPKIAVAYNFFLVKQFCEQLPDSILEAARIDGAKELRVFWTIAMPLLKPAWTTLAVFSFVNNWNDYFSPLIFISSNALKTLPLALQTLSGGAGVVARAGTVGAATFLTTVPSILVFAFMRGKVMETMSFSGIKS